MSLRMPRALDERYSPVYFLSALGAGGLTANFFVWLLFWVPHPGQPVPVFEDIVAAYSTDSLPLRMVIGVAIVGIVLFALLHVMLLIWNLREYGRYRHGESAQALRRGNLETQLLALPLTVAMTINVGFVLGMVFVPGLWSVVEWLFPAAMVAFLLVGIWALRLLGDFYGRVLTKGGFDCARNNSFAQMLPAFALSMVGVGLAAPAAMSNTPWVAGLSYLLSSFFVVAAVLLGTGKMVLGMRAMMEGGANAESAPTLWIGVPILTVLAITLLRQDHGAHVHLGAHTMAIDRFDLMVMLFSAQIAYLLLGAVVLRRHGYFRRFIVGRETSPGSWVLICPGVAFGVMLHFFTNQGLVAVGLIERFDPIYWTLSGLSLFVQFLTIVLMTRIAMLHFTTRGILPSESDAERERRLGETRAILAQRVPEWPERLRARVARESEPLRLNDGDILFQPGDACPGFVLMLKGRLRVEHHPHGSEHPALLYRADAGESCILTTACVMEHAQYQARGIAEGEVELLRLPQAAFQSLMSESDTFRGTALSNVSTRMSRMATVIDELLIRQSPPRPAA